MDRIIHTSVEQICSQGTAGLSLSHLFTRLHAPLSASGLTLSPSVKQAVLNGLFSVPGLVFKARDGSVFDPKSKPSDYDQCEGFELTVFADEQLRRCFVGLYDVKASHITLPQQRVLELLARARENGVTQSQLCKELDMRANNFFYVVKRLESWGLVVRHSTIVRTKEASSDKEPKTSAPKRTNLIRLHRYAPPLSSQQRLEITIESNNLDEKHEDSLLGAEAIADDGQDDVLVNDFLPALKAICDRLEQAEGKVLVVSDIKRELGYRETRGHRAWRNVCNRLKQAGLVEIFEANVDAGVETPTKSKKSRSRGQKKPVNCLKLLKKFSPKLFEHRTPDCEPDDLASDQHIAPGKQVQNTEQLVELPLEQQIVDMIDAEGSKGLLGVEVCKRLGISNKMLDNLSSAIVPRFGLHQLSENHKRGLAYRFWTRGNHHPNLPNSSFTRLEDDPADVVSVLPPAEEPSRGEDPWITPPLANGLNSQSWLARENKERGVAEEKLTHGPQEDISSSEMVIWAGGADDVPHNMSITSPHAVNGVQSNTLVEAPSSPLPKPFNHQRGQRYPSLTSATRELRILEKLEIEKIIIKSELQRWLDSCDKDKQTKMDRKTLQRCLIKLKHEGRCKLMEFNIPGVSNCGRHRVIAVVVHPSVKGSARELSEQVHDKLRSFDTQIRSAVSPPKKQFPVPVLHGIERIQVNSSTNAGIIKSEAMRANGFVLAKMVRTKLLHCFLWDYVNKSSARSIDIPTPIEYVNAPSNPHSSCLLFSLDNAIKAMPLELFLQVVGSALKWKDMIEKCKNGLLLSDFPDEEYKSLMDTRATSRLSWLIDILRRLKLIKLVADENLKDVVKPSHATLEYALELKPYIEEPPSVVPLPGCSGTVDLRPHFRHDFVLSTAETLEKYWLTLEYCYAAADPKAAVHAFPGSMAYEVCLNKSWTRVRVMKAEQRAELLKRIKAQQSKKLTFKECREIAKELKLTLDQVLRFYYDNRQQRLDRFQTDSNVQAMGSNTRNDRPRSQLKRKRHSKGSCPKDVMVNNPTESFEVEEGEHTEQEQEESLTGQYSMPILKQARRSKFSWTEEANRQLIVPYARQRAIQGARPGTNWSLITDLPTSKRICRKRLAYLNRDDLFRKSLIRLCHLLSQRYAQHLDLESKLTLDHNSEEVNSSIKHWDDFEDSKIKAALNEALVLMKKCDSGKRIGSASEGRHKPIASSHWGLENGSEKQPTGSTRKSRRNRLSHKFVKNLKEGVSVTGRINQSLAVSSAVELFKLVFLTSSKSADMPNLLAETLHCYSEHDLYSAFDYLRQNKILIGSPFLLSQTFLRGVSTSQFPTNTWKRAARLASWIHKKEEKLMEGVVNLPSDLQCGDIFKLLALVSSGELSISPILPDEGVGEAEDSKKSKRKSNDHEDDNCSTSKKQKHHSFQECELYSRREKGFPGMNVSLSRMTIMRPNALEFFKDDDQNLLSSENDHFYATLGQKSSCVKSSIDHIKEAPDFSSITPTKTVSGDSLWEVMANYTIQNWSNHFDQENIMVQPELFKKAYINVQKAGDQGLSMLKVSECLGIQGTILSEHVVNVLELYGFVLKVNGYDYVHIVDALYRAKYFLTSKPTSSRDPELTPSSIPQRLVDATNMVKEGKDHEHEVHSQNANDMHKVTILNLSEDSSELSNAIQAHENLEGSNQTSTASIEGSKKNQNFDVVASYQPILPWINGDGTLNVIAYRGLTRRILGLVTQNPGILEDGILRQINVLNPQSCRRFLELMVLDKHLLVRKMCQRTCSATPPALLESLCGNPPKKSKYVSREHYFANPMSTALL